jgi:hypothetical protein
MKVLSTNVQSPKQLNAPSIITQMGSSQTHNDNLKDNQGTTKQE